MPAAALLLRPLRLAIDLILPPRCPGCGTITQDDHVFCGTCWGGLRLIGAPHCAACGIPFELDFGPDALCATCIADPPRFQAARAALAYDDVPRRVLMRFKHGNRPTLARTLARQMSRVAGDWLEEPDLLLVPVPLHRWRLWRRGYNQAALLAQALSRMSGRPLLLDALVRRRATKSSGSLSRKRRRANVRGAFAVPPARRDLLRGRHVVLIDDVLTSGATADACTLALNRAGAASVRVLTFARVLLS